MRRMFGAQVGSVVRWLFGCGFVGLLVVLIVPLFLSFLAMPGVCGFLRVPQRHVYWHMMGHQYGSRQAMIRSQMQRCMVAEKRREEERGRERNARGLAEVVPTRAPAGRQCIDLYGPQNTTKRQTKGVWISFRAACVLRHHAVSARASKPAITDW